MQRRKQRCWIAMCKRCNSHRLPAPTGRVMFRSPLSGLIAICTPPFSRTSPRISRFFARFSATRRGFWLFLDRPPYGWRNRHKIAAITSSFTLAIVASLPVFAAEASFEVSANVSGQKIIAAIVSPEYFACTASQGLSTVFVLDRSRTRPARHM
jgi:hypothetical protein